MRNENAGANNSVPTSTVEQIKNELQSVKAELSSTKDELDSVKNEFHNYRRAVSKKFSGHEDELEELEARFEDSEGGDRTGETGSQDSEMLPIERIARMKEGEAQADPSVANTTPSVERAVTIFQHFGEWSSKAQAGRVIQDNLKNLLNTATGESLAWKQVYRACRKLEEWSKGAIEFIQHDRHGWILVGQSSSAGNG